MAGVRGSSICSLGLFQLNYLLSLELYVGLRFVSFRVRNRMQLIGTRGRNVAMRTRLTSRNYYSFNRTDSKGTGVTNKWSLGKKYKLKIVICY